MWVVQTEDDAYLYYGQASNLKKREKEEPPERSYIADWSRQRMVPLVGFNNDTTPYKELSPDKKILRDCSEVSATHEGLVMVC